jgi:NHLM bacteriocin system ABC transporter ATP-binding protein
VSAIDPGLALRTTSLPTAFEMLCEDAGLGVRLGPPGGDATAQAEPAEAIEQLAQQAGLCTRQVLLDAGWWDQAAVPMLARVADRRQRPRDEATADDTWGRGWVVLLPGPTGGYRMRAAAEAGKRSVEWPVDPALAGRLAPFAYAFHRRFAARPLAAADMLRFALREGGPDLGLLMLAGLVAALVGLLTPLATGHLIDRAIPAGDDARVLGIVAGLAVAGFAVMAVDVLRTLAAMRFEARVALATQAALVDRLVSAPAAFFRGFASGDLALRLGSVNVVQRTLTGSTIASFVTSIFLVANLGMMLHYNVTLTVAAVAMALGIVAVSTLAGLRRLAVGPRIEALDGRLNAMTFEMFAGVAKLRAAAAETRVFGQWYARYDAYRHANGDAAILANRESVALSLLYPAATILVLLLAWRGVGTDGGKGFTTGDFVAFHTAMFALLGGVHLAVSTLLDVVNLRPVWDRARPILETLPENPDGTALRHAPEGAIRLEGVTFAYGDGPAVLHDIDLEVAPGEFVAIVGASGSGKSTLLRLLLGFERPATGHVRYDGHDLATLDPAFLRRRIGAVLQGGKLWAGDLLTNIVGATHCGPDAAMDAARRAGLAPDIEAMPMGLYTVVGEGLSTLSGGQRQRVMLARALVARPTILLLDEATSALDNVAQRSVLQEIAKLDATRIVIAHRIDAVRDADRIVVLERGRIVQQGRYEALATQRGAFATLLARQVA